MSSTASLISRCPACGASNRVPVDRLTDTGRCGACKADLPPAREPIEVDEALFDAVISSSKVPVFVDFWAAWCAPCRMAAPEVKQLAQEVRGQALVLKVDTEANPGLAGRFRVQSIPRFLIFQNGQVVFERSGVVPHTEMRRWLTQASVATAR